MPRTLDLPLDLHPPLLLPGRCGDAARRCPPVRFARRWGWIGYLSPVGQVTALSCGALWVAVRATRLAGRVAVRAVRLAGRVTIEWFRSRTRRVGGACFNLTHHVDRRYRKPYWWSARICWIPVGRQR